MASSAQFCGRSIIKQSAKLKNTKKSHALLRAMQKACLDAGGVCWENKPCVEAQASHARRNLLACSVRVSFIRNMVCGILFSLKLGLILPGLGTSF